MPDTLILFIINKTFNFEQNLSAPKILIAKNSKVTDLNKPNIKICALEPDKLTLISNGVKEGSHKIEGIGDDFIPCQFHL